MLIEADIGVKISRKVLVRYYKEFGVVHRRLAWMTLPRYDPERQLTIKQSFVGNLLGFMRAGKEIIYFDETSTHLWQQQRKIWMPKADPIKIIIPRQRGPSITILGAISNCRGVVYHSISHSTNAEAVLGFFKSILRVNKISGHNAVG